MRNSTKNDGKDSISALSPKERGEMSRPGDGGPGGTEPKRHGGRVAKSGRLPARGAAQTPARRPCVVAASLILGGGAGEGPPRRVVKIPTRAAAAMFEEGVFLRSPPLCRTPHAGRRVRGLKPLAREVQFSLGSSPRGCRPYGAFGSPAGAPGRPLPHYGAADYAAAALCNPKQ